MILHGLRARSLVITNTGCCRLLPDTATQDPLRRGRAPAPAVSGDTDPVASRAEPNATGMAWIASPLREAMLARGPLPTGPAGLGRHWPVARIGLLSGYAVTIRPTMPLCQVQMNSVVPFGAVNLTVLTSPWRIGPVLTPRLSTVKLWFLLPSLRTSTVTGEPAGTSRSSGWNLSSP